MQLLLLCLRIPKLSNMAATSLDMICGKCAGEKQMLDNFPLILQVVREVDSFNITSDATVKIIKGRLQRLGMQRSKSWKVNILI